jgi:hypothetical protein
LSSCIRSCCFHHELYSSLQDTNKAIEVYRKLFALFPDNLNYGLRLADKQRRVNSEDALKTVAALRRLPGPVADDPRIDMIESRAWINNDCAKAQAAGRRAVEKGTAQGARLLVARAYGILCETIGNGSSTEQAIRDCQNASQIGKEGLPRGNTSAGCRSPVKGEVFAPPST